MGGIDESVVRKLQQPFVQAGEEHRGEFLRRVVSGQIGPSNVTDEKRVAGERRLGRRGVAEIRGDNADALKGVTGRLQKFHAAVAELDAVTGTHGSVRKARPRSVAQVDGGAGPLGKLQVAGNEIRMEVRLDHVRNLHPKSLRGFKVNIDVALWVDDRSDAVGSDKIRSVRETSEEELFNLQARHRNGQGVCTG